MLSQFIDFLTRKHSRPEIEDHVISFFYPERPELDLTLIVTSSYYENGLLLGNRIVRERKQCVNYDHLS